LGEALKVSIYFQGYVPYFNCAFHFWLPFISFTAIDKTEPMFIGHFSVIIFNLCLTQYSAKASSE
jgi:hypothetical protein